MTFELKEPTRKKYSKGIPNFPFPVFNSESLDFKVFVGKFIGDGVMVENKKAIKEFSSKGFFGKGSLSRGSPEFCKKHSDTPEFTSLRQWKRRCNWSEKESRNSEKNSKTDSNMNEDKDDSNSSSDVIMLDISEEEKMEMFEKDCENAEEFPESEEESELSSKVVVVADSDNDENFLENLNPIIQEQPYRLKEKLYLTLEEAFFLCYGLGVLQILDLSGKILNILDTWALFCKSQKRFIEKYIPYHYFRAKGWIVKPGIKYGGDFLLYKDGPTFYHSSYVVLVEVIEEDTLKQNNSSSQLTWTQIMGINRLSETAAKEVLICQVIQPTDLDLKNVKTPLLLRKFKVHEMIWRRWISTKEREKQNTSEEIDSN